MQPAYEADSVAGQRPGAAVLSVGLVGGECYWQQTVVPGAECTRNGGKCPDSSLTLKYKR